MATQLKEIVRTKDINVPLLNFEEQETVSTTTCTCNVLYNKQRDDGSFHPQLGQDSIDSIVYNSTVSATLIMIIIIHQCSLCQIIDSRVIKN